MTTTTITTAIGIADTIVNDDSGSFNDLNTAAQLSAAIAGLTTLSNPVTGNMAVTAGMGAMATGASSVAINLQSGKLTEAALDGITILGDAAIVVGAIASQVPGGQTIAGEMEAAGNFLTLAGVGFKNYDKIVANTPVAVSEFLTEVNENVANIKLGLGGITPLFATGNSGTAWGNAELALYNTFSSLSLAVSTLGQSTSASNMSALSSTLQTLQTKIADFTKSAITSLESVTTTLTGNSFVSKSSNGTVPTSPGSANITSDGTSTTISGAGLTSGSTQSSTVTVGSNSVTRVTQGKDSSGATQYTQTVTSSSSGKYSSTVTAQGQSVTVNNAPSAVSIDSTGKVQVTLDPSSTTGLGRVITLSSTGTVITIGGSQAATSGSGSNVTLDSLGNLSVTNPISQGWSQTTTINGSNLNSSLSSVDANGNPITIAQSFAALAAPVVNQMTMAGATFNGGTSTAFQNFVNSTALTQASSIQSSTRTQIAINLNTATNNFVSGLLPPELQYLNPVSSIFQQANIFRTQATNYIFGNNFLTQIFAQPVDISTRTADVQVGTAIRVPRTDGGYSTPCIGWDPLVISTNRQGINFVSLDQSQVQFDYAGNGAKQATAWLGANTGFIALPNGSTPINASNLLTFASLSALDSNHDGLINASDSAFANLRVWTDINNDGVSQTNEFSTLTQLGITSIGTSSTAVTESTGGNVITAVGSLTFTDGTTEKVADVTLAALSQRATVALQGRSTASLTFLQRMLSGLSAKAQGTATADDAAVKDAMKALAVADALLASDLVAPKPPIGAQIFDPTLVNLTQSAVTQELFQASDTNGKTQLWITNATGSGGVQLTNITGGLNSSNNFQVIGATGKQLFQGNGSNGLRELWVTDGTTAGTQQLTTITGTSGLNMGALQSGNYFLTIGSGNKEIFKGNGANGLSQLWATDGTVAGTQQLTLIGGSGGLNPSGFLAWKSGKQMFAGNAANGSSQIWVTDGTTTGTQQITSIGTSAADGLNPSNLIELGTTGKVLFKGYVSNSSSYQLWVTDGTAAGTVQLTSVGGTGGFNPSGFLTLGTTEKELFQAKGSNNLNQLWATDGTGAGTIQLTSIGGTSGLAPTNFISLGASKELFQTKGTDGLNQLWGSDGTVTGTLQLTSITSSGGLSASNFYTIGTTGKEIFSAKNSAGINEIWGTDGTASGTVQLTTNATYGVNPDKFISVGAAGKQLFRGVDDGGKSQLWVTDGTILGTLKLTSVGGAVGAQPMYATALGTTGKVLMNAQDGTGKFELWVSDGTASGTLQLTSGYSWDPLAFTTFSATKSLFVANDSAGKRQVFITDGTNSGTIQLTVAGGSSGSLSGSFFQIGNSGKFIFNATDVSGKYQLWTTDGTVSGTQQITNLSVGLQLNGLAGYAMFGTNKVVFEGAGTNGTEQVWITDGTAAGTSQLTNFTGTGESVYQFIPFGTSGKEIFQSLSFKTWVTDGTAAGTQLWTSAYAASATNFIVPNVAIAAPSAVRQAEETVNQALQATSLAAQYVQIAAGDQTTSDIAAVTANIGEESLGSPTENNAWKTAATTENDWHVAFANIAMASTSLTNATTALSNAETVVSTIIPANGSQYISAQDAKEASDTAAEQAASAQALAVGQIAYNSLLAATAQSWNASQTQVVLSGQSLTATGNNLIVAAAGSETINEGTLTNTYAILQGANVQISNFHAGPNGSKLDFLSQVDTITLTQLANGTQITAGTSNITLSGVNISTLSLYDNFVGTQKVVINGAGVSASQNPANSFISDGTTHVYLMQFGTGGGQLITGSAGYNIYNYNSGSGADTVKNGISTNNGSTGELDFGSNILANNLSFAKNGNDLALSILGSSDKVTISDWFGHNYSELQLIKAGDGIIYKPINLTQIVSNNAVAGTSQLTTFTPSAAIASEIEGFSSLDATGTRNNIILNWTAGGSQKQQLTGLAAGLSQKNYDYTGINATGTLTGTTFDWTAGGSQLQTYINLAPNTYQENLDFSGSDCSGTHTATTFDWNAGGSQLQKYSNTDAGTYQENYDFSAANCGGTLNAITFDWTAGGSQLQKFTGLPNGVAQENLDFSAANCGGTLKATTFNWTAGGSQLQKYTGLAAGITQENLNYSAANCGGTFLSAEIIGSTGNNAIAPDISSGNETLTGNGGYDTYYFGRNSGADSIHNGLSSNTGATGELDFYSGIATNQLWLKQSGNDLQLDIMGTHDQVTVTGWFSNAQSKLQEIKTYDGSMIDSQLNQLVQAMATYSSAHAGFDPTTVSQAPTDSSLQAAIASSWHH